MIAPPSKELFNYLRLTMKQAKPYVNLLRNIHKTIIIL